MYNICIHEKEFEPQSGMMIFCKTKPLCSNISVTCRCLLQGQLSELNIDRINRSKSHHALARPFARLSDVRQRTPMPPNYMCVFINKLFLEEKIQQINKMFPTSAKLICCFSFDTIQNIRKCFLCNYYCQRPNVIKFTELMSTHNETILKKICMFIVKIYDAVCPP